MAGAAVPSDPRPARRDVAAESWIEFGCEKTYAALKDTRNETRGKISRKRKDRDGA